MTSLVYAVSAYLFCVLLLFVFQRSLLYPAGGGEPAAALGKSLGVEVIKQPIGDEGALTHWYLPPKSADAPVFLVFHGNAGHIGDRATKLQGLTDEGAGLFLFGYRGYGGNPGKPSEEAILRDAQEAYGILRSRGIDGNRIVLYGESLGSGVAVALAGRNKVRALVLEAPYSSIAQVAQAHYWYVPVGPLLWDKWDSLTRIREVETALFVVHGRRDRTIPLRFAERLFAAANEPKTFHLVEDGDHVNLHRDGRLSRMIRDFVKNPA
jgi:fermentation-respiration switch protein FrsA (DUF1100 family)